MFRNYLTFFFQRNIKFVSEPEKYQYLILVQQFFIALEKVNENDLQPAL